MDTKTWMDSPSLSAGKRRELSETGLRAFFKICEKWDLGTQEQMILLGGIPRSTFYKWKKGDGRTVRLPNDTLERLSYIVGIYRALHSLFTDEAIANRWIQWPSKSPLFGGSSPKDRMLNGRVTDLAVVRKYLDAQR
jgi:uncharacterized protein (DUF2384 family)